MGQTGYPAVDAVMNQLRNEGWISHKGRELVLCFLTRGDLFLFWKMGMDVLATYAVDHEYAINGYQWHNLSCELFVRPTEVDPIMIDWPMFVRSFRGSLGN